MKLLIFPLLLFVGVSLPASPQDSLFQESEELSAMSHLIQNTQSSLEEQKRIYNRLSDYLSHRLLFQNDDENKELACELIAAAQELKDRIQKAHLMPYFKHDFIEELDFFSQIAQKQNRVTPP